MRGVKLNDFGADDGHAKGEDLERHLQYGAVVVGDLSEEQVEALHGVHIGDDALDSLLDEVGDHALRPDHTGKDLLQHDGQLLFQRPLASLDYVSQRQQRLLS